MPYADQHMKYSQTSTSASPPPEPIDQVMFELDQSPVRYGRNMSTNAGMHSRPPVTYPNHTAGRTPKTLKAQTMAMSAAPRTIGRDRSKPAPDVDQSALEKNSDCSSVPATRPFTDSTTDQPIQYPNVASGPISVRYLRQASCA